MRTLIKLITVITVLLCGCVYGGDNSKPKQENDAGQTTTPTPDNTNIALDTTRENPPAKDTPTKPVKIPTIVVKPKLPDLDTTSVQ